LVSPSLLPSFIPATFVDPPFQKRNHTNLHPLLLPIKKCNQLPNQNLPHWLQHWHLHPLVATTLYVKPWHLPAHSFKSCQLKYDDMRNLGYSNEIYIIVVLVLFISLFHLSQPYFIVISYFSSIISLVFHCISGAFFISYHYFLIPISLIFHCTFDAFFISYHYFPSSISLIFHCTSGTFFISYHYFPSPISLVSHCLPSSISFLAYLYFFPISLPA